MSTQLHRSPSAPAVAPPGPRAAGATATSAVAVPAGRLHRLGRLRDTTPGRLQLIMTGLIVLALAVGVTTGFTAQSAAGGTGDLGSRTQPLLLEAETIYSALADADATAAQAFLAGGLEPRALTERYDADLDRAATALTSAARRTPDDGPTAKAVGGLSAGLAEYASLIATARANNRQGLPVGASYLSTASLMNRNELQPQAQTLLRAAPDELDDGYAAARSTVWVSLLALLLIGLLVALLVAQRHLSRVTRRTFNLPLVAATAVTAVLALGVGGLLVAQRGHLRSADADGSTPIALLAQVRILTLQERSDEALTLAGRGSNTSYEADFTKVKGQLAGSDGLFERAAGTVGPDARPAVEAAATGHQQYVDAHTAVRKLDDGGDYDGAVELAVGPETTATFTAVTDRLGDALETTKATFDDEISAAGRGLSLLTVLGPVLALIIAALAAAGVGARLEEYRWSAPRSVSGPSPS